eukprot:jgi/Mesen1/3078/ME000183S02133
MEASSVCRACIDTHFCRDKGHALCPTCGTNLGANPGEKLRPDSHLADLVLKLFPLEQPQPASQHHHNHHHRHHPPHQHELPRQHQHQHQHEKRGEGGGKGPGGAGGAPPAGVKAVEPEPLVTPQPEAPPRKRFKLAKGRSSSVNGQHEEGNSRGEWGGLLRRGAAVPPGSAAGMTRRATPGGGGAHPTPAHVHVHAHTSVRMLAEKVARGELEPLSVVHELERLGGGDLLEGMLPPPSASPPPVAAPAPPPAAPPPAAATATAAGPFINGLTPSPSPSLLLPGLLRSQGDPLYSATSFHWSSPHRLAPGYDNSAERAMEEQQQQQQQQWQWKSQHSRQHRSLPHGPSPPLLPPSPTPNSPTPAPTLTATATATGPTACCAPPGEPLGGERGKTQTHLEKEKTKKEKREKTKGDVDGFKAAYTSPPLLQSWHTKAEMRQQMEGERGLGAPLLVGAEADDESSTHMWIELQAWREKATPQRQLAELPKKYLKARNREMPISKVRQYVAQNLGMRNPSHVEMLCRGQPLLPALKLQQVLNFWNETVCDEASPTAGSDNRAAGSQELERSSGNNQRLVLSYRGSFTR